MSLTETFRIALTRLVANRLRTILTMLGIIIGVGAVITLVSFGQGVERYVKQSFLSIGSNVLFVFTSVPTGSNPADIKPMTPADADAIANPLYAPSGVRAPTEYDLCAVI